MTIRHRFTLAMRVRDLLGLTKDRSLDCRQALIGISDMMRDSGTRRVPFHVIVPEMPLAVAYKIIWRRSNPVLVISSYVTAHLSEDHGPSIVAVVHALCALILRVAVSGDYDRANDPEVTASMVRMVFMPPYSLFETLPSVLKREDGARNTIPPVHRPATAQAN